MDSNNSQVPETGAQSAAPALPPKSKLAFILLGVFLGQLGIHNFYIGRTKVGVIQLLITLLLGWIGGFFIAWIWAIVDIIQIKADAQGQPLV